jgi:adenylate cyclase
MFTDMVGYTALGQRNESLSIALVEEQRKLIRPILKRHNGREVKTMGDAFLVEFLSALDAVRCGYDIQRATREFNIPLPDERRVHLRVGVHLGDIVESQGDISGDAVNVASRIEPLAEDGGVCLSRQVYDNVRNKFELPLESLGQRQLKNVSLAMEVYKIVMPWSEEKTAPSTELDKKRIAVLPLISMSSEPADEYFADGLTEELISRLSLVKGLRVIARTSTMNYKGVKKRISDIGTELKVASILEGSVRKSGNRIRATMQLIDIGTEEHLWASSYDRDLDDIFAIQSEIAETVARELKVQLVESEKERLESRPTTNTEAYTLYLKGRHYWNERSEEGIRKAVEYFDRAVRIDPKFALGYAGLSDCYHIMGHNALAEFVPSYEKAGEYADKALALDPNLAEAHAALAGVKADYHRAWGAAEYEYKKAIELKPSYSHAHQWYGVFLGSQGRMIEADVEIRKALALDPLSLIINVNVGNGLYYFGRFDAAIEQFKKVIDIAPAFAPAYQSLIETYCRAENYEEALRAVDTITNLTKQTSTWSLKRGYVFACMGKVAESRELLKEAEEGYHREHLSPYGFALAYFQLGDDDAGFGWLNRAYEERDAFLPNMNVDYEFMRLKGDPRYTSMLRKLGLGNLDAEDQK